MKIKLDENLPELLLQELNGLGHDIDSVRSEGLKGRADGDIWRAAQAEERLLITQDLDFSDARSYTPGHAGLLLIRLATPGRKALIARIVGLFLTEAVDEWHGCLVVATDHKVRVKRTA